MIVECEKCSRRFNLPDAVVPAQGARVRCSKCHHRFHVMPPSAQEARTSRPREPKPPVRSEPAPPESAPAARGDDPDLENPEFLFESDPEPGPGTPEPDAGTPEPDAGTAEPDAGTAEPDAGTAEPEDDDGAGPPSMFFGVPQPTALEDLASAPEPGQVQDLEAAADVAQEVRQEVFGMGGPADPGTREPVLAAPVAASPAAEPEPHLGAPGETGADAPLGWDSLETQEAESGANLEGLADELEPEPLPEPASAPPPSAPAPRAAAARARAPSAPAEPTPESVAARLGGTAVRTSAIALGVVLTLAGLRVLVTHGMGAPPGPEAIRSSGWIATEIEASHRHDRRGRRVLVVRGNLILDGAKAPPVLRATLLDAGGAELARPFPGLLRRLDGSALEPDALSALLDARGPRGRPPSTRPITGFTVLIPDPPETARRFRLDLLSSDAAL